MKDYYKILGVDHSASDEDIKKAYRMLAHKYHPDRPGGSEAKFKEINEAYQVLSDGVRRAQYDRFGTSEPNMGGFPGGGFRWEDATGAAGGAGFSDLGDLGDIFESFFEGMGVRPKRRTYERGADLEIDEIITLQEAFTGTTKIVRIKTLVQCAVCHGKGAEGGSIFVKCTVCAGRGEIQEQRRTFFGSFAQVKICPTCHGKGEIPERACGTCKGSGRVLQDRETKVSILPGVQDGQIIKVKGAGEAGERGMPSGDLYVRVRVKAHETFERRGDDFVVKCDIGIFDVLLGRKIEIPTISGSTLKVAVPDRFNLKDELQIRGEGMPHLGGYGRGDLYVNLTLKTLKKLSEKDKKALEEIEKGMRQI